MSIKEIPEISYDNLFEYIQLSQEFDIMKDIIEQHKKFLRIDDIPKKARSKRIK